MSMLSHPAFGPKVALIYVTVGALIDVWTAVYYFTFGRFHTNSADLADANRVRFWVVGFFLTGLVLVILGLVLGPLGRAARKAELPPADATPEEASVQQRAANNPNPVIAGQAAGMVPGAVPAASYPAGVVPAAPVVPAPAPQPPRPAGYPQPTI